MDEEGESRLSADALEQLREFVRTGGSIRLARYAAGKLGRRRCHGVRGGLAPGGRDGGDLAQEAIDDLVAGLKGRTGKGSRAWNPAERELYKHLCDIVDSKIYKLVRRPENRLVTPESAVPAAAEDQERPFLDDIEAGTPNPEDALIRKEEKRRVKWFFAAFFDSVADDSELQRVLAVMQEGALKPKEIAERMRVSAEDVYNIQKRLRRRLVAFEHQWNASRRETPETVKGK